VCFSSPSDCPTTIRAPALSFVSPVCDSFPTSTFVFVFAFRVRSRPRVRLDPVFSPSQDRHPPTCDRYCLVSPTLLSTPLIRVSVTDLIRSRACVAFGRTSFPRLFCALAFPLGIATRLGSPSPNSPYRWLAVERAFAWDAIRHALENGPHSRTVIG